MPGSSQRTLDVRLEGPAVRRGTISVRLLTRTLGGIQKALVDLGEARLAREVSTPGRKPELLERECELFVSKIQRKSFTATLGLREKEPALFPEWRDFAESLIGDLERVAGAIESKDSTSISRVVPDPGHRAKLIRDLLPVIPAADEDYELSVHFPLRKRRVRLVRPSDEWISKVGGPGLAELAERGAEDALIQARAKVRWTRAGELKVIGPVDVIQYRLFEEEDIQPYSPTAIEFGEERLELVDKLDCRVFRDDGLVVVEYAPLGIIEFRKSNVSTVHVKGEGSFDARMSERSLS